MKKILYINLLSIAAVFSSCVNDLGNDTMSQINKIEISGIEESYSAISKQETITINPEIKGSLSASDESNLSYEWFLCDGGIMPNHNHITIGTERNLNYFVDQNPHNYTLYFAVTDNSTGLKWEAATKLSVVTPMVRGFYIIGDKADGFVGMDFISYMTGKDTTLVTDIYTNTKQLKGAKNLVFTGYYYNSDIVNLWAIAENGSYQLNNSSSLTIFGEIEAMSDPNKFLFPIVPVQKPEQVMNIVPTPYGSGNTTRARSRILFTKDNCYAANVSYSAETYGDPVNCYSASSPDLFKPSPFAFYKDNTASLSAVALFDETNHRFVVNSLSNYSAPTYFNKAAVSGTAFDTDQTKYSPVRNLVYGENGYGNAGRSYALMSNENGEYFVYCFTVANATTITANAAYDIDLTVATEFANADHYTFFSMQPIILYSVGSKLYAYDYYRKDCKLVNTFDGNITYLSMDYHSSNDPKHLWVATYGTSGKIYGYSVEDNQNAVNVTPVKHEVFDTELKVVKMAYRNCSL